MASGSPGAKLLSPEEMFGVQDKHNGPKLIVEKSLLQVRLGFIKKGGGGGLIQVCLYMRPQNKWLLARGVTVWNIRVCRRGS